jgi:hypothetical protein
VFGHQLLEVTLDALPAVGHARHVALGELARVQARVEQAEGPGVLLVATNIAVGCGLREQDIRNDGWPRASARTPEHAGVEMDQGLSSAWYIGAITFLHPTPYSQSVLSLAPAGLAGPDESELR